MKKLLILSLALFCLTNVANAKVISNEKINKQKVKVASKIITDLQKQRDVYREINRIILRENLDLRDTLEDKEINDQLR